MDDIALLKVDPCPDADGHTTIRWDDGSENGDTEKEPVATVYNEEVAHAIASAWNAMSRM